MSDQYEVHEEKPDHHFRTEIPHIIQELDISANAFRLYCMLKKIAGDYGSCYKTSKILCVDCKISKHTLIDSLQELENIILENGQKIIEVTRRKNLDGSHAPHLIKIVDVWRYNGDTIRERLKSKKDSKDNRGSAKIAPPLVQNLHQGSAKIAPKEEPINKNPEIKKVNDPLPPKPDPEKLTSTVPDQQDIDRSLTFQTQAAGHCFSPSEEQALATAAKFKLNPDQTETLVWLANQGINTDLKTLSWWARTESLKNLQNWHKTALKHKARDMGAYMGKLVQKKAIVVTDETKEMADFITEYLESNGINTFKIVDKYAVLYYPDGNECEIPLYISADSVRMKLDNYLDHLENNK